VAEKVTGGRFSVTYITQESESYPQVTGDAGDRGRTLCHPACQLAGIPSSRIQYGSRQPKCSEESERKLLCYRLYNHPQLLDFDYVVYN